MKPTKYLKGSCQQCDGHIEFPAEMAGLPTTCPHCGQTTELLLAVPPDEPAISHKALLWTATAVLVLGLGLLGAILALKRAQRLVTQQRQRARITSASEAASNTAAVVVPQAEPAEPDGLQVSGVSLQETKGTSLVYAVGTLKNSSTRQRFGVKVQLALLDAAGQKLGVATDYHAVLEPGGEWRFKALVVDSKAVSARLDSVKEDQ